jgi:hypothetical protein
MDLGLAVGLAIAVVVSGAFVWSVVARDIKERMHDEQLSWFGTLIRLPGWALHGVLQRQGTLTVDGLAGTRQRRPRTSPYAPATAPRGRLATRKCRACGERYSRKKPYCPVCKHGSRDTFGGITPPSNPLS